VILPVNPAGAGASPGSAGDAGAPVPSAAAAGWFGKVPFLGDFASRRLPDAFIEPWDEWLQHGLAASRAGVGDGWLDLYLTFPVWRFVMPPGLVGEGAWIGVFLPSIDRVGRCFPLTICEPVGRGALEQAGLIGVDGHLVALAEAGIEALDASSVGFLEQRLAALGPLRTHPAGLTPEPAQPIPLEAWLRRSGTSRDEPVIGWPLHDSIAAMAATAGSRFMVSGLKERVLWWSPADDAGNGGALVLAPYPFSGSLLGNLIGTS
jgi:type VI secretion system protein ImpM